MRSTQPGERSVNTDTLTELELRLGDQAIERQFEHALIELATSPSFSATGSSNPARRFRRPPAAP